MPKQPVFDDDGFVAYCADKENWSKERALREAFDWYVQADLTRHALSVAEIAQEASEAINEFFVDLIRQSNMAHLLAPEALEQSLAPYLVARHHRLHDAESVVRQAMEVNAKLAATTAVSEKQRHAASGPRSRSPNSAQNRVTDAMHIWRRSNSSGSLRDFLAAVAGAEDDYEFRISELANGKYEVDCEGGDEADDGKEISWSGLEKWWGKSAKERH